MERAVQILGHPLLLLIFGAVVSGWLVPKLTQRLQDHRKALEIKADLVERVTRAVITIFTTTQFVEVQAKSQSQSDFDASYRVWQNDKAVLTVLLSAYFRSEQLDNSWLCCRSLTTAYYVQIGITQDDRRRTYLESVAWGLSLTPPEDWAEEVFPMGGARSDIDLSDPATLRSEVRRNLGLVIAMIVDTKLRV